MKENKYAPVPKTSALQLGSKTCMNKCRRVFRYMTITKRIQNLL